MHHAAHLSSSEACGNLLARDILKGHALPAMTFGSEGIKGQGKAYQPVDINLRAGKSSCKPLLEASSPGFFASGALGALDRSKGELVCFEAFWGLRFLPAVL